MKKASQATPRPAPPAVHCRHDALVPPAELHPNPKNPHRHPPAQIEALAALIAHHGWRHPILVSRRSGLIVAGHGRLEAARALGLARVPVCQQDFASDADELAFLLADNRIPELAEMDDAALQRLVADDLAGRIDLTLAGLVDELAQPTLVELRPQPAPAMSWVLVGIPTVRFGEIADLVERLAAREDTLVETTVTNR